MFVVLKLPCPFFLHENVNKCRGNPKVTRVKCHAWNINVSAVVLFKAILNKGELGGGRWGWGCFVLCVCAHLRDLNTAL